MILYIAEKPSVGRDIAKALGAKNSKSGYIEGNGSIITWCVGHLVSLAMPEAYDASYKSWKRDTLPIIPKKFTTQVLPNTQKQFDIISSLMNRKDVTQIVCATDAGREGELIFRLVYNLVGCKKPYKRLWISSMTDEAIKEGLNNLIEGDLMQNLYLSAMCRACADWLVGINFTRLYTIRFNQKLTVGRVQTPTLAMVCQRQHEIDNFKEEIYYNLKANFENFSATWTNGEDSKIDTEQACDQLIEKCQGHPFVVQSVQEKNKNQERPFLYNLTDLQVDANKRYGKTAQKTLDICQALYEKHKIITYPRTDSRFISEDMRKGLISLAEQLKSSNAMEIGQYMPESLNIDKRIINNAGLTDHHAILPTPKAFKYNLSQLNGEEKEIMFLIMARLILSLCPKHTYKETQVMLTANEELFKAVGKRVIKEGFKEVERKIFNKKEEEDKTLPKLKEAMEIQCESLEKVEKKTTPKKPYTEATLLNAMENAGNKMEDDELKLSLKGKGIGTPATRAGIIEKLVSCGYLTRERKNILPTESGKKLISRVPESIKSAKMTAEWEHFLTSIEKGTASAAAFMHQITSYVRKTVG